MGTEVTTNLGLIKPDTFESIKENLPSFDGWASQNADNCDTIDALFRQTEHTYTPTWTATSSNPTLGSGGFITGKYARLFPRIVLGWVKINAGGAGFNPGSGAYSISAPVAIASELDGFSSEVPIGKAILNDNGTVLSCSAMGVYWSPSGNNFFLRPPGGGSWTEANPITLAQNDSISMFFKYPTSVA